MYFSSETNSTRMAAKKETRDSQEVVFRDYDAKLRDVKCFPIGLKVEDIQRSVLQTRIRQGVDEGVRAFFQNQFLAESHWTADPFLPFTDSDVKVALDENEACKEDSSCRCRLVVGRRRCECRPRHSVQPQPPNGPMFVMWCSRKTAT